MKEKKIRGKKKYSMPQHKFDLIKKMLLGPFEPEWRDKNGIVDNRDIAIAKRMRLSRSTIAYATQAISEQMIAKVNERVSD